MIIRTATIMAITLGVFAMPIEISAQSKKKKKDKTEEQAAKPESEKQYDDIIKKCKLSEGLFNIYRDTVSGKSYLEVKEDQLGKEFIYFSLISNGVVESGFFRGSYRGSKIISFTKHFEKIEINSVNTTYYFDENNALSKAANANIDHPLLSSLKIEGRKEGKILIDGDGVFLSEDFQMIKPPSDPRGPGSLLGSLSKDKTKLLEVKNYPMNTDVRVSYVYDNKNPSRGGSPAMPDPRVVTVEYQHSLIEVPNNDFVPRNDDPRVGYFMTDVNDMTSFSPTPYRDMIHRWHLVKKNPSAAMSEPVEPITWWIENSTPMELRPIIKEGVERWNIAFEKAGFINAVVVNEQPDDADWDAGDIRYNVLRWTSSPQPPFGGYGPSFVNPRTGQILGADIMLEFSSITNRLIRAELFGSAALISDADFEEMELAGDHSTCEHTAMLQRNLMMGMHTLRAWNMDKASQETIIKQFLQRLVLHEVGHTLGLMHNMRASSVHSPEQLKQKSVVEKLGLCNSVMEYPAIHLPDESMDHETYFDAWPRSYDMWAIEFGYTPSLPDMSSENKRMEQLLNKSTDPMLVFGNDADDMRSSGRGIDPDINIYDLSNDPVAYGIERMEKVRATLPKIKSAYSVNGYSYHELRNAFLVLTGEYGIQARIMTRQIAGVHIDRSFAGQTSTSKPFTPVEEAKQKAAMKALEKYVFAPDAFDVPTDILNYLQMQRRGFEHFGSGEDPKIHDRVTTIQNECLNHLLHPAVLKRITDSQLYGNTYDLAEYMTDLSNAIFSADLKSKVNTYRQNLQIDYTKRLTTVFAPKSEYDNISQSMALFELNRIKSMMKAGVSTDTLTKAHREYVVSIVDNAMEKH